MSLDNHKAACDFLSQEYPETAKAVSVSQALAPTVVSPHKLSLPKKVLEQAQAIVASFHELRTHENYVSHVETQRLGDLALNKNFSALMSFDFHLNDVNELKLIEVNTNASSSLVVDLQYRRMGLANPLGIDFRKEIVATFKKEFELFGGSDLKSVAIIDEKPEQQKMFIEHQLYAELFRREGFNVVIGDPLDFSFSDGELKHKDGSKIELVYNRHTDFYLLQENSSAMRESYRALKTCFSPNPREYALLADKQRLQEISRDGFLESIGISQNSIDEIRKCLLKTFSLHEFNRDEAWAQRKKFFYKPARAYGGKSAYKGASISRGHFENLWEGDTVAQEFQPAPEVMLPTENGEQKFKFDLRFYTYQDKIQLCNARVYQGQTTNATTVGGGLTPIEFTSQSARA